ncbi:S41 family peptidase [Peribacillus alkalitolerans]|uniref:S41 family peptidase n=1 Tax=Peribacillus alkalitolerans TaxID=1550385 RepID=UPI0013D7D0A7|nr:S41 family peptidase [Peribacillus alkalitolerans]
MIKTDVLPINLAVREDVIKELVFRLQNEYIFPDKALEMSSKLETKWKNGEYDSFIDAESFSKELTHDLQTISNDRHLRVTFHLEEKSIKKEISEKELMDEYYRKGKANNYGFFKIERLAGNIGYIDLRNFEDPAVGGETAISTMNFISNTEALIFDLRKNGGGSPGMVALLTSYLFNEPTHLNNFYSRPDDRNTQSWTLPYVPGKRYINKPVYVLTSNYTFSAAEEFTYNLLNLKRATVVGEVTGGGANPGHIQQITKNFRVFIPTGRAINPLTNTNWEGTGVKPHVMIDKEEAFNYVYKEALEYVKNKYNHQNEFRFLLKEIDEKLIELKN